MVFHLLLQLQQLLLFLLQDLQLLLCGHHGMGQRLERHLGSRAQSCRSFTNRSCRQAAHRRRHTKCTHWGLRVEVQAMTHEPKTSKMKEKLCVPVNMLASSRSTRVPSLVEIQVKCKGSTSRSPVNAVKLPSAAAQLLTFPFPAGHTTPKTKKQSRKKSELQVSPLKTNV